MDYIKVHTNWLNNCQAQDLIEELEDLEGNNEAIKDRFYKNLEFGTGGLRGKLGAGTNRMNIYTVRKASNGLANYINKISSNGHDSSSIVIAYDSRHKSREFALESALVFAKNNIRVCLFQKIMPTPILSFAVRELQATAGIVITASHNPPEYNGYKVYWSDGGQITDNIAKEITGEIEKVEDELSVEFMKIHEAEEQGLLAWLNDDIFTSYINMNIELSLKRGAINNSSRVVYTPLHGTGYKAITCLLQSVGFKDVYTVEEQVQPDGDFPTVRCSNPEEHQAFELALSKAKKIDADIALATDPDADRLGVAVKDDTGKFVILTGNQLGALFIDYLLQVRSNRNDIPSNGLIVKTIVTSNLGVRIAEKYGIKHINVLTGFKYIGEKIKEFHESKEYTFLFGYEESYGYLIGDFVRDKDGIQACLLAVEMAAYYKQQGINIYKRLYQIYEEYGFYMEDLVSVNLEGIEGQKRITRIMDFLRSQLLSDICGQKIHIIKDYLKGESINLVTNEQIVTDLPKSNVIHYTLDDSSWFCVRPSGTEPKLKIYFSVIGKTKMQAETKLSNLKKNVMEMLEKIV